MHLYLNFEKKLPVFHNSPECPFTIASVKARKKDKSTFFRIRLHWKVQPGISYWVPQNPEHVQKTVYRTRRTASILSFQTRLDDRIRKQAVLHSLIIFKNKQGKIQGVYLPVSILRVKIPRRNI